MNDNTGIAYEIALALHLAKSWKISGKWANDLVLTAKEHKRWAKIDEVRTNLEHTDISNAISAALGGADAPTTRDLRVISQDDSTPGDIMLLRDRRYDNTSISVKYQTLVARNPTGQQFLTQQQIESLQALQLASAHHYITEMTAKYGPPSNWFRKRKQSDTNAALCASVALEVCKNWEKKRPHERDQIMRHLLNYRTEVSYITVVIKNSGKSYFFASTEKIKSLADTAGLSLVPRSVYVDFVHTTDGVVGRMQVKQNNGPLERAEHKRDGTISLDDGTLTKLGPLFSSWNFEIL